MLENYNWNAWNIIFQVNLRRTQRIEINTYRLDLTLSNKYLEIIIQCLQPKKFDEKAEFLF